jgi:hypothetical protein
LISLLVVSHQEDISSEIQNAVGKNYTIHKADTIDQLNDRLVDGNIDIIIIDAAFVKTTNQSEIIETLSFFPELTLIVSVESGETTELVSIFQSLEVYRYLQKPLNADQIKKCIDAAARKHEKNKSNNELTDIETPNKTNNKNILLVASASVILIIGTVIFLLPSKEETGPAVTDKQNRAEAESIINTVKPTDSELLNIDNEALDISTKSIIDNNSKLQLLLENAKDAEKQNHLVAPTDNNALYFYLTALSIEPSNKDLKNRINRLEQIIFNEINNKLADENYTDAVETHAKALSLYKNYKYKYETEAKFSEISKTLIDEATKLSKNKDYENALAKLNNATLLSDTYKDKAYAIKKSIESIKSSNDQTNRLTVLINEKIKAADYLYPDNDNVLFYLDELKSINSKHTATDKLEEKIVSTLGNSITKSINNNEIEKAKVVLKKSLSFNLTSNSKNLLQQRFNDAESQHQSKTQKNEKQNRIKKLSKLASDAIEKNNLIYPEGSSAKHYLQSALEIEPDNKKIQAQVDSLVSLMIIQIDTDIRDNTLASASSKIKITKELGVKQEEIAALEERLSKVLNNR